MRCYTCEQINTDTARFCVKCGSALAPAPWMQPAVAEAHYAPAPYGQAQPSPPMVATASAPPTYPAGYVASGPGPAGTVAAYGHMPAPASAPSMVNNVTVTQAPVHGQPISAPPVVADNLASVFGTLLRATYFLGSGLVVGVLWVAALDSYRYGGESGWAPAIALLLTIVVLLLNIAILHRFGRKS